MEPIDLDYWYTFGRAMALLGECFAKTPCLLGARDLSRISNAMNWLTPIASEEHLVIPGTPQLAKELIELLSPLLQEKETAHPTPVGGMLQAGINNALTAYHNVARSGAQQIHTFLVSGIGAYSATAMVSNAASHLSELAQSQLSGPEKEDFISAGACLACSFPTASGFHAMRALEAEARRYHMVVTGLDKEVDWTLDPLINGNSGKGQVGLRDQWKSEGAKDDSQLLLIITLLKSVAQIYRNPIMHPEMVLNEDTAKQIFDTAALAISAMVRDRAIRTIKAAKATSV